MSTLTKGTTALAAFVMLLGTAACGSDETASAGTPSQGSSASARTSTSPSAAASSGDSSGASLDLSGTDDGVKSFAMPSGVMDKKCTAFASWLATQMGLGPRQSEGIGCYYESGALYRPASLRLFELNQMADSAQMCDDIKLGRTADPQNIWTTNAKSYAWDSKLTQINKGGVPMLVAEFRNPGATRTTGHIVLACDDTYGYIATVLLKNPAPYNFASEALSAVIAAR